MDALTDRVKPSKAYDDALVEMYKDVPNVRRSLKLLEKAHRDGDARATYALATWYLHGRPPFVKQDLPKAISLLKIAADAGIRDALYDIGIVYEKGESGIPDERLAFESYLKAAVRGEQQSVYEVGRCYEYGIGVPADPIVAKIWLDRASELGVSDDR